MANPERTFWPTRHFVSLCWRATLASALALALVVENLAGQAAVTEWRLSQQPVFSVGGDQGPAGEFFTRIVDAFRLEDGRLVVADGPEFRISVYNADGRRVSTFGNDGEGPGEFRSIAAIWSAGGDSIGVYDSRLQRITRFGADGSVIRTDKIEFVDMDRASARGSLDLFLGSFRDGRIAIAWLAATPYAANRLLPDHMTIGVFDSHARLVRTLGRYRGMERIYIPDVGGGPIAFSPYPWAAIVRDALAYTNGADGSIVLLDPDADSARARQLTVPGPDRSLREAWADLDDALEAAETPSPMIRLSQRADRSMGSVPRFARMFADDAGRLWLKDFDPGTDALAVRRSRYVTGGSWRIVDTSGRQVARITMPENIAPLAVDGNMLIAIARDELDVESLVVLPIVR